jgi:membrane-bound lytic murein transglycosylase B
MKLPWALLSTLALTSATLVTGVAAVAATEPTSDVTGVVPSASLIPTKSEHGFYWQLLDPQDVLSGTLLVAGKRHEGSHGTRSDKQFFEISSTGSNDVPEAALRAYHHAARAMATTDPGCDISWTLLAAIGRVESNHGRFGGAALGSDGISRPEIRGPQLNGAGPFAAIRDTDKGVLDHDVVWDRAVGQMQFLPETWASVARDGDGDGRKNPDDIDDSALGSAVYLCGVGGSLADPAGAARAAFRYNHSDYYVQLVLSFANGYQTGVFAEPSPPPPSSKAPATQVKKKAAQPRRPTKSPASKPAGKPLAATPSATPRPAPKPVPKPSPTPTPTGPTLVRVEGSWKVCGLGWCLGDTALDLGTPGAQADLANADFDRDGTVERNAEEFAGLVGKTVTLQVERKPSGLVVYVINGDGLRNADGSFARTIAPTVVSTGTP